MMAVRKDHRAAICLAAKKHSRQTGTFRFQTGICGSKPERNPVYDRREPARFALPSVLWSSPSALSLCCWMLDLLWMLVLGRLELFRPAIPHHATLFTISKIGLHFITGGGTTAVPVNFS
jgi:hypothetical protein